MTCWWTDGRAECHNAEEFEVTSQTDGSTGDLCWSHTVAMLTGLDTNTAVTIKRLHQLTLQFTEVNTNGS